MEKFIIGSYTNHTSKGIYKVTLNESRNEL